MPRDAAHERRGNRNAGGGGGEVMDGQRDHLREIGHGGFTAVALPVGVGGETDGGVEREMRGERAKPLRIERQNILQAQDGVGEHATHQAEQQHGPGVLPPVVLLTGAHAHEPVGEPLQRTEHGVEPSATIGVEHLREVKAHGLRNRRKGDDVEGELQPAGSLHKRFVKIFQDRPSR